MAGEGCRREVRTLGESDLIITEEVERGEEFEVDVETDLGDDGQHAVVVRSELLGPGQGEEEETSPLYFNVGQSGMMKGWQISYRSQYAERVLCPTPGDQKLRIFVSTLSTKRQKFRLTVGVSDFLLAPGQAKHHIPVALNAPRVFRFHFPGNDTGDNYEVKITNSSLAACTIISIQKAQECPQTFFDDESNIRFGSSYQTMLEKSAMIVSKERYPDGFNLVLLGLRNNSQCYMKNIPTSEELGQSSMNVSVVVKRMKKGFIISENIVTDSILMVFGFYFSIALFFLAVTWILDKCFGFELEGMYGTVEAFLKKKESLARKQITNNALKNTVQLALIPRDQVDGQLGQTNGDIEPEPEPEKTPPWTFPWQCEWQGQDDAEENNDSADRQAEEGNVDDVDGGETNNVDNTRPWVKVAKSAVSGTRSVKDTRQTYRTLDQTCRTLHDQHRQRLRSQLFSWLIVLAGIFYALPAFQMVFNHQNPFLHGGDQDICYYNFFCVFPYGKLADFGHVFSNVGYAISGLYFIIKVYIRRLKFEKISSKLAYIGIPEQVGIFYALGGALTLEGVLSGIYHICPTSANFQFDTTFMFFIAVLIFLKLYQFRHADTTLTAQLVFLLIGVVLTLEVIGYFTSNTAFWVLFIITYMFFMLIFILKIYLNEKRFKTVFSIIYNKLTNCCSFENESIRFCNLLPCIIVILINILMATFFAISARPGVSRYLLAILMINMMCYEVYYVSRKIHLRLRRTNWRENEGIRPITLIYLLMSLVFMAGACYFFIKELKTSAGTPAESRNKNDECVLLIFDNHDMWHFLSAAGLYQHLMFVLTLEDYNIGYMKQRKHIAVF